MRRGAPLATAGIRRRYATRNCVADHRGLKPTANLKFSLCETTDDGGRTIGVPESRSSGVPEVRPSGTAELRYSGPPELRSARRTPEELVVVADVIGGVEPAVCEHEDHAVARERFH